MKKPADWMKRTRITFFYLLTFAISWGLGFAWDAAMGQGLLRPAATAGPVPPPCKTAPTAGEGCGETFPSGCSVFSVSKGD